MSDIFREAIEAVRKRDPECTESDGTSGNYDVDTICDFILAEYAKRLEAVPPPPPVPPPIEYRAIFDAKSVPPPVPPKPPSPDEIISPNEYCYENSDHFIVAGSEEDKREQAKGKFRLALDEFLRLLGLKR